MITYEYKYITVEITDSQKNMVELGVVDQEQVAELILNTINPEGEDGWEAIYPFSFPTIWFRRTKNTRKKSVQKD